jgi:hypothetical protein
LPLIVVRGIVAAVCPLAFDEACTAVVKNLAWG